MVDDVRVLRLLRDESPWAQRVLTAGLSDAMRKAVGFRNILVHEYVEVSDEIVVFRLTSLGDLEQFVEQVTAFMHDGPRDTR